MKKWIFEILDKILDYREQFLKFFCKNLLISIFVTVSLLIGIYCVWVIGTDIFKISSFDVYKRTDILRNILLGLGALIAVPFLVWQNTTSHKSLKETKNNNQNTQKNNDKTQEAKMYIDCITQLANEKETIRTSAIHGLHELIKNTENDSLKEKIFNILWSFMVEHSKKCIKINEKIENFVIKTEYDLQIRECLQKRLQAKQKNIEKFYSQFKIILEILAEYKDKTHTGWWLDKSMRYIWLRKINLEYAVFKNANLTYAELKYANLERANLQGTNLERANLQNARLFCAELQDAYLSYTRLQKAQLEFAKLQGAMLYGTYLQYANLQYANLQGVLQSRVNLQGVDLQGADLQGISLQSCDLRGSKLQYLDLRSVNLRGSDLQNAQLQGVNLQGCDLYTVNLQGCNLYEVDLGGSDLSWAKLQGADLRFIVHDAETNFKNAKHNSKPWIDPETQITYQPTQFPENFDPKAHGMIDESPEEKI